LIELSRADYWRLEDAPSVAPTLVDEVPVPAAPLAEHRAERRPVWDGITRTRWGWYALVAWTFAASFCLTLEVLAIRYHVSF